MSPIVWERPKYLKFNSARIVLVYGQNADSTQIKAIFLP